MRQKKNAGQSTMEYAVLAAVVVGALLAMQIYIKRGAMGKLRAAADQMGEQFTPLNTTSTFTTTSTVAKADTVSPNGTSTSTLNGPETQSRTGSESVGQTLDSERLFGTTTQ